MCLHNLIVTKTSAFHRVFLLDASSVLFGGFLVLIQKVKQVNGFIDRRLKMQLCMTTSSNQQAKYESVCVTNGKYTSVKASQNYPRRDNSNTSPIIQAVAGILGKV